ncbi:hypothetical protein FGADI_8764 [Fusarium gaditjirri]|uniref:F-box domain-containing protein n=1 Tax=Fusarium gaditjirri TaxID=282569 RepID=A0A8H4T1U3_9HYPO|nr:hypothetical protein FGADI_8764 [Fusarium gaditjirri]
MSSPSNNTNNQQQSALPNLPTEILLEILHEDYMDWEDYYRLRRASSRLFQLAHRPMYRGEGHFVFRNACFRGDLDALAICAQYGAVPTECSWTSLANGSLGLTEPGNGLHPSETEDSYQECSYWNAWGKGPYGPGDVVILGFYEGNFSAERFIEVWQWLSDQGCELFTSMTLPSGIYLGRPYFSYVLMTMLPTATDKAHHQGICDVIHFLYNKGLRIPHLHYRAWRRGTWPAYYPLARLNCPNLMMTLLQVNCPPSILELYLRQARVEGLAIDYGVTTNPYFKGLENVSGLLHILFDDMFAPWIYQGDGTRSMSDDLQAKICLLTQYQGANAFELYMLQDILTALRKIDARKESRGGLDFERDGVWCWYELCMAVGYISDKDVQKQTVDLHFKSPGDAVMINPYFSRGWFPPKELALARRKVLEKRTLESGQKTEGMEPRGQKPTTRKWTQMPLDAWDYIL